MQRLTVYNHFPGDSDLFGACQAHWMQLHPLPDFVAALSNDDPHERVRAALRGMYQWYRATEPMTQNVQRDRGSLPALDSLMQRTADAQLNQLATALAAGLETSEERRALMLLALDFWTWRRLSREGLTDDRAAGLLAGVITGDIR